MIFTVNYDAGIVIARYVEKNNRDYWVEVLVNTLDNVDVYLLLGRAERYDIVDEVMSDVTCLCGKAKLNPFDVFDEEIGKRVAVRNLNHRFNKAKNRVIQKFERVLRRKYLETMNRSVKRRV